MFARLLLDKNPAMHLASTGAIRQALLVLAWLLSSSLMVSAQDIPTQELDEIEIEALRSQIVTKKSVTLSASVLSRSASARNLEPGLSLEETLSGLPGLWINERGNAAIGERISIRGMGWRAAFGVRGVQILLDGIPLTMPDGQAFADIVTPSLIQRAELIRGPASLYWGNGSGGVVYLTTLQPNTDPGVRLRAMGGSYGLQQITVEGQAKIGTNRFQVFVNDDRRDGYRNYSKSRFTRASFHGVLPVGKSTVVRLMSAFADQDAENPGSLTADQVGENPRLANTRNVNTFAAKRSQQFQLGGTLLHESSLGDFSATAYGIFRDLDNPLSFAYINLNRSAGGARFALEDQYEYFSWGIGVDAAFQSDDRINRSNDAGNPGDERLLEQHETVQNFAAYSFVNVNITDQLSASAGVRADQVQFEMEDKLLDNGDQSGNRDFSAITPSVGISYAWEQATLYGNYRSAFETPTTTELVNRPDLNGGFNPDVAPQKTKGFELGLRGSVTTWALNYDIAVYSMNIEDRLTPFSTDEGGDRTFYRNAGRNLHQGIEFALDLTPVKGLTLSTMHTSNAFEYKDDELSGARLPGVPDSRTQLSGRYDSKSLWARVSFEHVSSYFVNDANTELNEAYQVVDLNLGHPGLRAGTLTLQPFFTINNLFDAHYSGSVIINAFGGGYYEPAPGRTFQLGVNVSL